MNKKQELLLDIIAFGSILMKLGFDDCVTNQQLFVEMCNEVGFRTVSGKKFSQMSFVNTFKRLSNKDNSIVRDYINAIELSEQQCSISESNIYNV